MEQIETEDEALPSNKFFTFNQTVIPVVNETPGNYWFVANVIAEALGYKNPRQAASDIIRRHPEDFEGYINIETVAYPDQNREVAILNEQGVYVFCMLARSDLAVKFRRMVAEKIKEWRESIAAKPEPVISDGLKLLEQQLQMFQSVVVGMKQQELAIQNMQDQVDDLRRGLVNIDQPLREQFTDTCKKTAILANMDFRDVFNRIYELIKEQKHIDVRRRAANRTKKIGATVRPIDIIEQLGMLGYAVQLAKTVQADLDPRSEKWRDVPDRPTQLELAFEN